MINDLQKTQSKRAELALLIPILLAVVLDPQFLRPLGEHLNLQLSHLLFIHLQCVLLEPGLLLCLGLLESENFLQRFLFLIKLREPFLDQDLIDSYIIK